MENMELKTNFNGIYSGKKVLITGNTGFKGTWLTEWLNELGAQVIGISDCIPTEPSMYSLLETKNRVKQYFNDINDLTYFKDLLEKEKPDFVFHLAAQALVGLSYSNPFETITTNVMGGTVVLEAIREYNNEITVVFITSDKAYENIEQLWGYKENDKLGGKDIYSSSKGSMDILARSYWYSFYQFNDKIQFGVARAGNVIGGGDWAKDRIIVDCINSWSKNEKVNIRSPRATRPWQHVLEPLSGYLSLGMHLKLNFKKLNEFQDFNFGPKPKLNITVEKLISDLANNLELDLKVPYEISDEIPFDEAKLLKLNCEKAAIKLNWEAVLEYSETVDFTGQWYSNFIKDPSLLLQTTKDQIINYVKIAKSRNISWTRN